MPRRCARPPSAAAGVRGATTGDLRINSHPAGFSGAGAGIATPRRADYCGGCATSEVQFLL